MKLPPEQKQLLQDRFQKELWPLNKVGNPSLAESEMIHVIEDDMLFTGGPVTFDVIMEKYKEHLRFVKSTNSDRDPKFHTKADDIGLFIMKKRYNEDFIPASINEINKYLYGD